MPLKVSCQTGVSIKPMERSWVLQRGTDNVYRVQRLLSLLEPRVDV